MIELQKIPKQVLPRLLTIYEQEREVILRRHEQELEELNQAIDEVRSKMNGNLSPLEKMQTLTRELKEIVSGYHKTWTVGNKVDFVLEGTTDWLTLRRTSDKIFEYEPELSKKQREQFRKNVYRELRKKVAGGVFEEDKDENGITIYRIKKAKEQEVTPTP